MTKEVPSSTVSESMARGRSVEDTLAEFPGHWVSQAETEKLDNLDTHCRIAKFKNGWYGLKIQKTDHRGVNVSEFSIVLAPTQLYQLAVCIFKQSGLIKALVLADAQAEREDVRGLIQQIREMISK